MTRKVFTKEIAEALDIKPVALTHELMFEREQAIEENWLKQFRQQEEIITKRIEERDPMKHAKARIGDVAQSALHVKGIVIPPLSKSVGNGDWEIDEEAMTQVMDATLTYINMGRDFEILLQAIKDSPMLESEWERFMISLRMVTEG